MVLCIPDSSHYAAPYGAEAWLVFGSEHPDLFWDYLLAVSMDKRSPLKRADNQTFAILDNFGNSKIWDVTTTQIQSAYIDTALDLLEKNNKLTGNREAVHKDMLAKLQVTDYINGGSVMFAESKLLSKSIFDDPSMQPPSNESIRSSYPTMPDTYSL